MCYPTIFSRTAKKDLKKLPREIQKFILNKLDFYASQLSPLEFAKPLVNLPPSTHRFRIRKYRVSFFIKEKIIYVERIELRGQAYRS